MIVFFTTDWKLDLTSHKLTFIEENSLFYNYFVSGYSLPFSIKLSDEMAVQLGFVDQDNITDYQTQYIGFLQQDGNFSPAILEVDLYDGERLSGSFVFGYQTLPILDTKLSDLPWPVITTDNIENHAKSIINKGFPEVGYNFPMIIDTEFDQNTNYEKFEGIFNNYNGTNYVQNSKSNEDGEEVVYNRNVITPYPYLIEILKVGFQYARLSYAGDFFSDPNNSKLIWDTGKFLEQMFSPLPPSFRFERASLNTQVGNNVVSTFKKTINVRTIGSYTIKIYLNLPNHIKVNSFKIKMKGKTIYTNTIGRLDKFISLNVEETQDYGVLELEMSLIRYNVSDSIEDISAYNNFTFLANDGKLNVFPDSFSIADVLPNMTFSTFLNKLKNWFNLDISFQHDTVTIDYVEQKFVETSFRDESHLEAKKYIKKSNQNKAYILKDSRGTIYVTKKGIVSDISTYKAENVFTIDTGVDIMKIEKKNSVFTARRREGSDFRILLYDGLKNRLPVAVSAINGFDFSIENVWQRFWKKWLRFRVTSETIKDKFRCDVYENLTTERGRYKYNKTHLVKKISKRRIKENTWEVRIESETL